MSYQITAHAAIRYFLLATMSGDREVGGYAKFHIDEHGTHIITDLRPIKQESTECYFEISEKENALFLEKLVADGEDPKDWAMLFHTHPSGMDADMSGVDVKQIEEMAKDLPGQIARSMILSQGRIYPLMHEAICVDGRVFMRKSSSVQILDTTNAHADLKAIGWFDPKPKKPVQQTPPRHQRELGMPGGALRQALTTPRSNNNWGSRGFTNNDGWYDEMPERSEVKHIEDSAAWEKWTEEKQAEYEQEQGELEQAKELVGRDVLHKGHVRRIVDCYSLYGCVVYQLDDNDEVWDEDIEILDATAS